MTAPGSKAIALQGNKLIRRSALVKDIEGRFPSPDRVPPLDGAAAGRI